MCKIQRQNLNNNYSPFPLKALPPFLIFIKFCSSDLLQLDFFHFLMHNPDFFLFLRRTLKRQRVSSIVNWHCASTGWYSRQGERGRGKAFPICFSNGYNFPFDAKHCKYTRNSQEREMKIIFGNLLDPLRLFWEYQSGNSFLIWRLLD